MANPDTCTVSGVLYDLHGQPMPGVGIRIRNISVPSAVGTTGLVLGGSKRIVSDEEGAVSFALIQGAQVRIEVPGREQDFVRTVTVPEQVTIDLIDLLYPRLVSVDWDDDSVSVTEGEQFSLTLLGAFSDGTEKDVTSACEFEIGDEDIVTHVSGRTFRAVGTGSTTITVAAVDTDELEMYQEPDGDVIERVGAVDPTLPDPVPVTVS